jgi:hypothetical protein
MEASPDPVKLGHNLIVLDIYIPPLILRKIHGSELGLRPENPIVRPLWTVWFAGKCGPPTPTTHQSEATNQEIVQPHKRKADVDW